VAELTHFYHLWLGGAWRVRAAEHFQALRDAGFPGPVHVGLVGPAQDRLAARELLAQQFPVTVVAEAEAGFEEVTLRALSHRVRQWPGDTAVLYAHAKGTFNATNTNLLWAGAMTDYLVGGWRERVAELARHDLAVQTWLDRETLDPGGRAIGADVAAGNFWWARADYLAGLPWLPEGLTDRYAAEGWVGQDSPAVACQSRDWPSVRPAYAWVADRGVYRRVQVY